MKKRLFISIIGFICIIVFLNSCNKRKEFLASSVPATTNQFSFLKILDFSPAFRQVTSSRDSFNIYVNLNKVNGAFLTYGSVFPSISNPYLAVPSGASQIRITLNGVLTPDSITLGTLNKTLNAGSYYSFIITDSVLKANEAKQIFVKDDFASTDTGHFTLRFVHAIVNDSVGKNVDVYSVRYGMNIFSNISPGTATSFTSQAYTTLADTLIIRRPGLLFELGRLNGASFGRQRAYTIIYKGDPAIAGSTGKARSVTQYTNL